MSNSSNAQAFFDRLEKGEPIGHRNAKRDTVFFDNGDALYSYGHHFPLVVPLHNEDGSVRLWLLNGDNYSVTTTQHQSMVRGIASRSRIPSMILPFSALDSAGIRDYEGIKAIEVKDDWFTEERALCRTRPQGGCSWWEHGIDCPGEVEYQRQVHHLGASVFEATRTEHEQRGDEYKLVHHTDRYLSAFDEQERAGGLYFLCQLPSWVQVTSYEEALEALKPVEVVKAEAMGEVVTRQGDIFAVPDSTLTKRELRAMGATFSKGKNGPRFEPNILADPTIARWGSQDLLTGAVQGFALKVQQYEHEVWKSQRSLLHTAHTATEIAVVDEDHVFARGHLYHDPSIIGSFRERDHVRRKIGDGKTWHRIVQNTVPHGQSWSPRAWTLGGRVD